MEAAVHWDLRRDPTNSVPSQGCGASWSLRAGNQHQVGGVAWGCVLDVKERRLALADLAMALGRPDKTTHLEQESPSSLWTLTSA